MAKSGWQLPVDGEGFDLITIVFKGPVLELHKDQ